MPGSVYRVGVSRAVADMIRGSGMYRRRAAHLAKYSGRLLAPGLRLGICANYFCFDVEVSLRDDVSHV